ncbi:MAG: hypothetical protein IJ646_04505 [Clostridia bacterium]|nr:hypothetical protein [Clostridia bacterium]
MSSEKNNKRLPRYCPLLERTIEIDICFDICMVAETMSPLTELPTGLAWSEKKAEQCLECDEHLDK